MLETSGLTVMWIVTLHVCQFDLDMGGTLGPVTMVTWPTVVKALSLTAGVCVCAWRGESGHRNVDLSRHKTKWCT